MTQGLADRTETVVKIEEIKTLQGNTPTLTGSMYAWNQKGGIVASSTGNMTGLYDMLGGAWEKTASYVANDNLSLSNYAKKIAYEGDTLKTVSTKYTMIYPHDASVDNNTKENSEENQNEASKANYIKNNKYGDGIREISLTGSGNDTWENITSTYPALQNPIMQRGGPAWEDLTGIFYFAGDVGNSAYLSGFRPVVVPVS